MMRFVVACMVVFISGVSVAPAQDALPAVKEAYLSAKRAMPGEFDGVRLADEDRDAASIISLNRQWQSLGDYLTLKAQAERPILPNEYARIVGDLDPDLQVSAIALDFRSVVIAATRGQVGHVMILTTEPGLAPAIWHISDYQESNSASEELKCWTSNGYGNRTCYSRSIGKLADTARHEHRFFVDGAYAQIAGGVTVSQLSVWKWSGGAATPVYAASYDSAADVEDRAVVARDVISIRERGEWTSLFACRACNGRQLLRQLRVTDEDVVDLGTKTLSPEIDFIDSLLTQAAARKNVAALAAEPVIAAIQSMNAARGRDGSPLLLVDSPKVERLGVMIGVCLHVDGGAPIRFLLQQGGSGYRAVGVLPAERCVYEGS